MTLVHPPGLRPDKGGGTVRVIFSIFVKPGDAKGHVGGKETENKNKMGKKGWRRAGGLKSPPAFNFTQTTLEVLPNALHIQRHVH